MPQPPARHTPFDAAARGAVRRIALARGIAALGRSALPYFGAVALAATTAWWLGATVPAWIAAFAVVGWVIAVGGWAWLHRPTPVQALAIWDQRCGRHEMFVSAYCFERLDAPDVGQAMHLRRAAERLGPALAERATALPVAISHYAWLGPLLLIVLFASGVLRQPPPPTAEPLSEAAKVEARRLAGQLDEQAKDLDRLKDLTPKQQEALQALQEQLASAADAMRKLTDQSTEQVLRELEARARAAEELAASLGEGDGDMSRSKMLRELSRHADTAEFASAAQADQKERAARGAENIAGRLANPELPLDEKARFANAVDEGVKAADDDDKKSMIGRHVTDADAKLKRDQPTEAAKQFDQIADKLRRAEQRERTQQTLEQLAGQLRSAGQRMLDRSDEGIRQLAEAPPGDLRQLGGQPIAPPPLPREALGLPTPGAPTAPSDATGQATAPGAGDAVGQGEVPVPGAGSVPGVAQAANPGAGAGRSPVPGGGLSEAAGQLPGVLPGAGASGASSPVPGAGAAAGGLIAGDGSAQFDHTPTKPLDPTGTAVVNAQVGADGESIARQVQGQQRREDPARQARAVQLQLIRAEEEALHDEPLPLSRRQQVIRYFSALREQLERQE